MSLLSLKISNFRNILSANLDFSPACNIFFGQNGSGKSSLLEALYYLGHGRSFRTHLTQRVINNDSDNFSLFAELFQNNFSTPIGIERNRNTSANKIRISGDNLKSVADLALLLPIQLINQNSFQLLSSAAKFRRKFFDWGLFHVEPIFLPLWKRLNRTILQRNTALKSHTMNATDIKLWNKELIDTTHEIHKLRIKYVDNLIRQTNEILGNILGDYNLSIDYYPGWNLEHDLSYMLETSFARDKVLGYTQYGAHKTDLVFKIGKVPIHDVLSRGQQKIFFFSLQIAQTILLTQLTGKHCLYLIDDLPAELDKENRALLLNTISSTNAQIFITCLNSDDICTDYFSNAAMFHVKHGEIYITTKQGETK